MTQSKFNKEAPAKNILELLDYLCKNSPEKYIFRGQTKHYGTLIPSGYRKAIVENYSGQPTKLVDKNYNKKISNEGHIKLKELSRLIGEFGRGLGNIIAQQYGITSECLDITQNPEIAAYFATRKYPTYHHYYGTSDNLYGVIYRFPILNFASTSNLAELNVLLEMVGKEVRGKPVWFGKYSKRVDLEGSTVRSILSQYPHVKDYLFTHPAVVVLEFLNKSIEEFAQENNYRFFKSFENTRISRQEGGFLKPSVIWECTVPKNLSVLYEPTAKAYFFKPGYAIAERVIAIEDLMQYHGLELFFFKHSDKQITSYDSAYLWPSKREDPLFDLISTTVYVNNHKYFEFKRIEVDDAEGGILDRGYY